MMGLSNGVHWVAWFINSFVVMFLSIILTVIVLKVFGLDNAAGLLKPFYTLSEIEITSRVYFAFRCSLRRMN